MHTWKIHIQLNQEPIVYISTKCMARLLTAGKSCQKYLYATGKTGVGFRFWLRAALTSESSLDWSDLIQHKTLLGGTEDKVWPKCSLLTEAKPLNQFSTPHWEYLGLECMQKECVRQTYPIQEAEGPEDHFLQELQTAEGETERQNKSN